MVCTINNPDIDTIRGIHSGRKPVSEAPRSTIVVWGDSHGEGVRPLIRAMFTSALRRNSFYWGGKDERYPVPRGVGDLGESRISRLSENPTRCSATPHSFYPPGTRFPDGLAEARHWGSRVTTRCRTARGLITDSGNGLLVPWRIRKRGRAIDRLLAILNRESSRGAISVRDTGQDRSPVNPD
jgi:hypothetical protein